MKAQRKPFKIFKEDIGHKIWIKWDQHRSIGGVRHQELTRRKRMRSPLVKNLTHKKYHQRIEKSTKETKKKEQRCIRTKQNHRESSGSTQCTTNQYYNGCAQCGWNVASNALSTCFHWAIYWGNKFSVPGFPTIFLHKLCPIICKYSSHTIAAMAGWSCDWSGCYGLRSQLLSVQVLFCWENLLILRLMCITCARFKRSVSRAVTRCLCIPRSLVQAHFHTYRELSWHDIL